MLKNYYQLLGLSPDCTKDEIKKAYRIYATKYHPDKQNSDKFFEERFKEIKEAYEILIDENKRAAFDSKLNITNNSSSRRSKYAYQRSYANQTVNDVINNLNKESNEKSAQERTKRRKVYYTSKDLVLNGLYINCSGQSYELGDYDFSTIRKDDSSSYVSIGIVLIILGVITFTFVIGTFFLIFGVLALFHKEYFVVLIGKKGDVSLVKGGKAKMRKISKLINQAINENVNPRT